ncbi:MAG: hypothetical protein ACI8XB_002757 [Patiriisocius sp.]|jgi:hypothetical protein
MKVPGPKIISFLVIVLIMGAMPSCKNIKKFNEDRAQLLEDRKARKEQWKKAKEDTKDEVVVEVNEDIVVPDAGFTHVTEKEEGDSLFMSYERTACFGRCPIYKLRIFDSGFTSYEGINFVEMMGMYYTQLPEEDLINLEKQLADMYFYQFEDNYDNENLMDLPSKIVVLNKPNNKKRIKARYEVPEELVKLFDDFDAMIDEINWKPGRGK